MTNKMSKLKFLAGTDQSSGAAFFLHESISDRNLAVRSGSVRFGVSNNVRRGTI